MTYYYWPKPITNWELWQSDRCVDKAKLGNEFDIIDFELRTKTELLNHGLDPSTFKTVEVKKTDAFWSFGVRFAPFTTRVRVKFKDGSEYWLVKMKTSKTAEMIPVVEDEGVYPMTIPADIKFMPHAAAEYAEQIRGWANVESCTCCEMDMGRTKKKPHPNENK